MRVVFAGTPAFALPTLEALAASEHEVVAVYTQPDRPAGRGRQLAAGAVKQYALAQHLPIRQPDTLRAEAAALAALEPDVMVVAAYGLLLPRSVLQIPEHGCLNVHASLLPRWRGAAPIARAIEAGDSETGVTIMQMEAGLDTGPILLQRHTPILGSDTTASLEIRLAQLGAGALISALAGVVEKRLVAHPQDDALACYAPKLQKVEAPLDWSLSAIALHRKIRALNPRPVATTAWHGRTLRVWDVGPLRVESRPAGRPGEVVGIDADGVHVQSGTGAIALTHLQIAGGRALPAHEFVQGARLQVGDRLGV